MVSAVPARIISIHAPTRGATILVRMFLLNYIFQSTLLQEERLWQCFQCFLGVIFQSTLLQEERLGALNNEKGDSYISIHAPTRGATAKMHNYPYTYL